MSARFDFDHSHECKRPDVAIMDGYVGHDFRPTVNRMCLTCGAHWNGNAHHAVFMIPRKQWDRWMSEPES